MNEEFWSFRNGDGYTNLYILDEIAGQESWWVDTVTPKSFRRQLFGVTGELHVWLNSPGGDAFAGAAIYDMLREYSSSGRGKTVAMVSLAASAASLIAMACDEIRISVLGTIMIHEPWAMPRGKSSVLRAEADVLDTIRDSQVDAYARRTGLPREKVLELMVGPDGNGTYMNARMATELGFADTIILGDGQEADEDDERDAIASAAEGYSAGFVRGMLDMRVQSAMERACELLAAAAADQAQPGDGDGTPEAPEDAPEGAPEERTREADTARLALLKSCLSSY